MKELAEWRSWLPWPMKPRRAAASWCWPRNTASGAGICTNCPMPSFVPFTAKTRMSGVDYRRGAVPQRRGGCRAGVCRRTHAPGSGRRDPAHRLPGRHAPGGGQRRKGLRGGLSQGYRQGRPAGPLRAFPGHGDQDHHDYRRQSADRRGHRQGSRRGRFPGRGQARRQAGPDPQEAGGRAPGGHDRRRHQRRPGPGPGRRRAWP